MKNATNHIWDAKPLRWAVFITGGLSTTYGFGGFIKDTDNDVAGLYSLLGLVFFTIGGVLVDLHGRFKTADEDTIWLEDDERDALKGLIEEERTSVKRHRERIADTWLD